jgi:hypothetical protein
LGTEATVVPASWGEFQGPVNVPGPASKSGWPVVCGHELAGNRPPLTVVQVLAWADAHKACTGTWPTRRSGPVIDAPGETWVNFHQALQKGLRGLPPGSSLPRLLAQHRGVDYRGRPTPLTVAQVLAWADAHHARTGDWPTCKSGPVQGAPGESWANVGEILAWADQHYEKTGSWPTVDDGRVAGAGGETWRGLNNALAGGHRGLSGGTTLARLLAEERGKRNKRRLPHLKVGQILGWADRHHERTGEWPNQYSGPVADAPGENWREVNGCLYRGFRGLPGGDTLPRLLEECRGVRRWAREA